MVCFKKMFIEINWNLLTALSLVSLSNKSFDRFRILTKQKRAIKYENKNIFRVLYTCVCLIITNSAQIFCDHWRNSRKPLFYFATRFLRSLSG